MFTISICEQVILRWYSYNNSLQCNIRFLFYNQTKEAAKFLEPTSLYIIYKRVAKQIVDNQGKSFQMLSNHTESWQ